MSPTIQENLEELITYATQTNQAAINAATLLECKAVLQNARLTLECVCKDIYFNKVQLRLPSRLKNLNNLIDKLHELNYIGGKVVTFKQIKDLGNDGAHSGNIVTREHAQEARQLLNEILKFFYAEILGESIPKELSKLMQTDPIKELQAQYKKLYTEDALNDVPLASIYVLPHATFWKHSAKTNNFTKDFNTIPSCSDLHQFVEHFIDNELGTHYKELSNPDSQALILLGAPGQGKTSFCKRVLHDFINRTAPSKPNVYYIKLRDIDDAKFLKNPFSYLIEEKIFPQTITKDLEEALIILDGLDELYLHRGGHLLEVDDFIQTLLKQLKSPRYKKAKVILTSRFGYLSLDKLDYEKNVTIASIDIFDEAQQIEWVEKYHAATPDREIQLTADKIREIHTKELFQKQPLAHFQELFEQPVLLHLFVLSGLEVHIETKRTEIYQQLFKKLGKRAWEEEPSEALKKIDGDQLKEISKAIAFEMYKNNKTFLNKIVLDEIQEVQDFYTTIGITQPEQKKELYRYLFIAFYWQEKNEVLEFLHKSLQEYLIAERIWDEFQRIAVESDSSNAALSMIWPFAAPQMISREIQANLVEIIENDTRDYSSLLEKMKAYFPDLLQKQFMQECLPVEPMKGGVHTFYLYLLVLININKQVNLHSSLETTNYINIINNEIWSDLFFISQHYCGSNYWDLSSCNINYSLRIIYGLVNSKIEASLLNGIYLYDHKFTRTSFFQSIFEKVNMSKTNFESCNLAYTRFRRSDLNATRFSRSNFSHSIFKKSHFRAKSIIELNSFNHSEILETDFYDVYLYKTNFEKAIFYKKNKNSSYYKTQFRNCTFYSCYFKEANLREVSFSHCKVDGSSFKNAYITKTDFSYATLDLGFFPNDFNIITNYEAYSSNQTDNSEFLPVCFDQASGDGTNFRSTKLKGTSFKNVRLNTANFNSCTMEPYAVNHLSHKFQPDFEEANLAYSSFHSAKLYGVNFRKADLREVNFEKAVIENYVYESFNGESNDYEDFVIYCSFKKANLENINFNAAKLLNIDFIEANLENANFLRADLSNCNFFNANLKGAILADSILQNVNFQNANLTKVQWTSFSSINKNAINNNIIEYRQINNRYFLCFKEEDRSAYPLIFNSIINQLKTVKSLYQTKGIHPKWKEKLIQEGYSHLFEAPKT